MTRFSITALRAELERALGDTAGVRAVYLFGSALHSETPADVDLVIVYEPPLTPLTAPTVGEVVEEAVARSTGSRAHLMFFSVNEAEEPGTLSDLTPEIIFGSEVAKP
jgi:predicted nucleotidyltransferase